MTRSLAILAALCCAALAFGQDAKPPSKDKPQAVLPRAVAISTIRDEKIRAEMVGIEDGKLLLKTEPPRSIPLDELDRIDFDKPGAAVANLLGQALGGSRIAKALGQAVPRVLSARWLGQDNHDVARADGSEGASGIQDLHIQLTGLPAGRKLLQVIVEQGQSVWRLDPSGTPNWKLVMVYKDGADTADLYAEPSQGDRNGQEFKITIAFDNGTTSTVTVKATSPTNHELKVAAGQPAAGSPAAAGKSADPLAVDVFLEGDGELHGRLEALGGETLKLATAAAGGVEAPLLSVRGMWFAASDPVKAKDLFAARLKSPGSEDSAVVRGQDQSLTEIAGQVLSLADGKLRFKYEGEDRAINVARVAGLVFAAHAKTAPSGQPYQVFEFAGGNRVPGTWTALADGALGIQFAWGAKVSVSQTSMVSIAFRNGKLVYLSDLEPSSVEETAYFDRAMPYQRDKNLLGEPLSMKGKEHRKGLAVHSRCVLTYDLEGKYAQFKSLVGFDDSVPPRGRVVCRVLGDGKDLFSEKDLRADGKPRPIELDVKGVRQLTLEVDFGEDENICDRVNWADARLFRE